MPPLGTPETGGNEDLPLGLAEGGSVALAGATGACLEAAGAEMEFWAALGLAAASADLAGATAGGDAEP